MGHSTPDKNLDEVSCMVHECILQNRSDTDLQILLSKTWSLLFLTLVLVAQSLEHNVLLSILKKSLKIHTKIAANLLDLEMESN